LDEQRIDGGRLDVLKELANIGVGNAVTSLSEMLSGQRVEMEVPVATLASLQDLPDLLGGAENPVAGVYIEANGELEMTILFVLPLESASNLIATLMPGSEGDFDSMGLSVLLEVGNILTGSYLNALSLMTDLKLVPTPPEIAVDMSGAIISTVLAEASVVEDELVLLKTTLRAMGKEIEGHILILPGHEALRKIFSLLGIG